MKNRVSDTNEYKLQKTHSIIIFVDMKKNNNKKRFSENEFFSNTF